MAGRRSPLGMLLLGIVLVGCSVGPGGSDATTSPSMALATPSPSPSPVMTPDLTDPPTPPPSASPEPLPSDLDPELVDAIRLRRGYGLRSDLAYVRQVAVDTRATNWDYGHPLYPEEFTDAQTRFEASQGVATIVRGYGEGHAEAFGGMYIDEATHAGVVSLWTEDLADHAAAIRDLVGPTARIAFGPARYPERDLRALQDEVTQSVDADWLKAIPAAVQGIGVDIHRSQVLFEVSSAVPDAVSIIEDHFGLGDRLRVESDGTGAALIPYGWVDGRVVPFNGPEPDGLSLQWESTDPGTCGGGDMGYGVDDRGRFALPCQVGKRTIMVMRYDAEADAYVEIGRATIVVPADDRVSLTIELTEP